MVTRNDITGAVIKAKPQTEAYRKGWDNIFVKKTVSEWLKDLYNDEIVILNPNGWSQDGTPLDKPISESDFNMRLSLSTIKGPLHKYMSEEQHMEV